MGIQRYGKLRIHIERLREELINSGMVNGLSHPETIRLSQELDKLIGKSMRGGK
jgi:hypothetical protein